MVNQKAIILIETALDQIIRSGKDINNIRMCVSDQSVISHFNIIGTRYGDLVIKPSMHVPKGYSYLIESPISKGGRGFAWITKKSPTASVGERTVELKQ